MKGPVAEPYRDIDFSRTKRGSVVKPEPGKTKLSIRLDNTVLEYFRTLVERAGGGSYQSPINDAFLDHSGYSGSFATYPHPQVIRGVQIHDSPPRSQGNRQPEQ